MVELQKLAQGSMLRSPREVLFTLKSFRVISFLNPMRILSIPLQRRDNGPVGDSRLHVREWGGEATESAGQKTFQSMATVGQQYSYCSTVGTGMRCTWL